MADFGTIAADTVPVATGMDVELVVVDVDPDVADMLTAVDCLAGSSHGHQGDH